MNKNLMGIAAFALLALALVFVFGNKGNVASQGTALNTNSSSAQQANGSAGQSSNMTLFSTTQYAAYSYQIYPGPISQQAQAALAGFNMTSGIGQNGTAILNITLIGTSQYQLLTVKPNYKLYIVETSFGDDSYHFDSSLGDDGFVMVDPNGYVV